MFGDSGRAVADLVANLELQSVNGMKGVCKAQVFICGALVGVVTADLLSVVAMWARGDGSSPGGAPQMLRNPA